MIDLRTQLKTILKSVHPRVYFQEVPDTAVFPYLTYDFPNIHDDGECFQLVTLDIDGWDAPANGDTTALEILMAAVNTGMNKRSIVTESYAGAFYLETKLSIFDDDPKIKRRKYTYQGRLFERS